MHFYIPKDIISIVYKKADECYIEWQRVTTTDNKWYNKWQRITTSDSESHRVIQRMIKSNNEFYSKW